MLNKKRNILINLLFNSTSFTIIGLLIIILIFIPLVKNVKKQLNVNKEISSLDKEIESMEKKKSDLKNLITYLDSDEYIEEKARLSLNFKKKGEDVIVIKEKDGETKPAEEKKNQDFTNIYNIKGLENQAQVRERSNFTKWVKYFLQ